MDVQQIWIREIAGDKPVIEDCAHSLLSEYKSKKTGTLGDTSFFSLAKYISAGEGGMIIVNNSSIDGFQKEIALLKKLSVFYEIKHSFIVYARSFFLPQALVWAFYITNRVIYRG